MIKKQNSLFEDLNIKEAIEFLRLNEPENEPYYLGFSGGKDSIVCEKLASISGVKYIAFYSATGIDPPELVKFIKRNYPEIIFLRPKENFYKLILKKGFPTKFSRWCCDELKKEPGKQISLNHRIMGIRREESNKRAARPRIDKYKNGQVIYKPVFDWREWEIWEFIDKFKLSYPALYDEGFGRIGCVVCPFLCRNCQTQLNRAKNRWPKIYKAFESAMYELYEDREFHRQRVKGYSQLFDEFLENWYLGTNVKAKAK